MTYLFLFPFLADINECATLEDVCGENSICINKIGSFKCSCKTGFQWDGKVCKGMLKRSFALRLIW